MHLIALCCCVFHVLHVYFMNWKMNMTNYFLISDLAFSIEYWKNEWYTDLHGFWINYLVPFLESVCPTRIPVASRDEKGFELMLGMKIHTKAKKIPGSLVSESAFALTASTDITENTR